MKYFSLYPAKQRNRLAVRIQCAKILFTKKEKNKHTTRIRLQEQRDRKGRQKKKQECKKGNEEQNTGYITTSSMPCSRIIL